MFMILLFTNVSSFGQSIRSSWGAPPEIEVSNGPRTFTVQVNGGASPTGTLNITLPTGYYYVAGSATPVSGSTITVSETSVSGNTAVLSLGNIPSGGNVGDFSYQVYATCSAIGTPDNVATYKLGSNPDVQSNAFALRYAKINITNLANSPATAGQIGEVYERTYRINNNGFGSIDTVYVTEITGIGVEHTSHSVSTTETGSPVTVELISTTTSGTNTTNVYRFIVSAAAQDGILGQNDYFTFTQNLRIISCENLNTSLNGWYGTGPSPTPCLPQNSTQSTSLAIDNSRTPNLTVEYVDIEPLTCGAGSQWFVARVRNTGSSAATNTTLRFGLGSYSYTLPSTPTVDYGGGPANAWIDAGAQFSTDGGATWTDATSSHSLHIANASNPAANTQPLDVIMSNLSVPVGQSILVRFKRHIECLDVCSRTEFRNIALMSGSYRNSCGTTGTTYPIAANGFLADSYAWARYTADMEVDAFGGQDYWVQYNLQEWIVPKAMWQTKLAGAGAYTEMIIKLPDCLVADISTLSINNFAGSSASVPSNVWEDADGVHIRFDLTEPSSNAWSILSKILKFKTVVNCGVACTNPEISARVIFRSEANCACIREIGCTNWSTSIHCPEVCNDLSIYNINSTFTRLRLGLPNNSNDGATVASGPNFPSKVRDQHFTLGDTAKVATNGIVFGPGTLEYAYLQMKVPTNLPMVSIGTATATIYEASTSSYYTIPDLPIIGTSPNLRVDVSRAALAAGLPGSFTGYHAGDSIKVTANFVYPIAGNTINNATVSNSTVNSLEDVIFENTLYGGLVPNPTGEDMLICGGAYVSAVGRYHPWITGISRVGRTLNYVGCVEDNLGGADIGIQYFGQYDVASTSRTFNSVFPFEINEKFRPEEYILTVPTGLDVVKVRIVITGQSASPVIYELTTPTSISGQDYHYNLAALFGRPIDEGFNMGIVPIMRGNCQAPAGGSGVIGNVINYRRTDDLATLRSFNVNWPYTQSAGNLSASASVPTQTVTGNEVSWEVQIANMSNAAQLPNVWLAKNLAGGGTVTITSIERLATSGGTSGTPVAATPTGIYQLGNIPASTNQYYLIKATFVNCSADSLQIAYGWSCAGYPSGVSSATCVSNVDLKVIPTSANLQVSIINQPSNTPKELCDVLDYAVEVKNPDQGTAFNLVFAVKKPAGITYVPGSYSLSHTLAPTAPSYFTIPDSYVAITADSIRFTIPTTSIANLPYNDGYTIKYSVRTVACDFVSNTKMLVQALGNNGCGSKITGSPQATQSVRIIGENPNPNSYTITSEIAGEFEACPSPTGSPTYSFTGRNVGTVPTYAGESLIITIPMPFKLGTITPGTNFSGFGAPTVSATATETVYKWNVPVGIGATAIFSFSAPLTLAAGTTAADLTCGNSLPIHELIAYTFSATCIADQQVCAGTLQAEGENETTVIVVNKPDLAITAMTSSEASEGVLSGTITVTNSNSTAAGGAQSATIKIYHDTNSNGVIDAGETLVGSQVLTLTGAASETINYSMNTEYRGALCPAIVVLEVDCACTNPVVYNYSCETILPVTLKNFDVSIIENASSLTWTTTYEVNSNLFEVERSNDAKSWKAIGTVRANGDSNNQLTYNFIDINPQTGLNYYRLKIVDLDGTYGYSPIRSISFKNKAIIYPNPVKDQLFLNVEDLSRVASIEIVDMKGAAVYGLRKVNSPVIAVNRLTPGVYIVKITMSSGEVLYHKITKE